jgi:hypothetical protein
MTHGIRAVPSTAIGSPPQSLRRPVLSGQTCPHRGSLPAPALDVDRSPGELHPLAHADEAEYLAPLLGVEADAVVGDSGDQATEEEAIEAATAQIREEIRNLRALITQLRPAALSSTSTTPASATAGRHHGDGHGARVGAEAEIVEAGELERVRAREAALGDEAADT